MENTTEVNKLIDNIFRKESGKLISVLTRIFGTDNLELAEDVVQESFLEAMQKWKRDTFPKNPTGWLYQVAKNKALNKINRSNYIREYNSDVLHYLQSPWTATPAIDHFFTENEIKDDQLRMMFTCCHPSISSDSQVALILKTLCGFSLSEIANAFLTTKDNINKRLSRSRKAIREAKIPFSVPMGVDLEPRLSVVLDSIYLIFNEGYNASSGQDLIRFELFKEAIRLTEIIVSHPLFQNEGKVYALLALMQFNGSRFESRLDTDGGILILEQQNRSLWDENLIKEGLINLKKSSHFTQASKYQILATISAYHCLAKDYASTDWKLILEQYDKLLGFESTPIVKLNRTVVINKVYGPQKALLELKKLEEEGSLQQYYLYHCVYADIHKDLNDIYEAAKSLQMAIKLANLPSEKGLIKKRLLNYRVKIS